MFDFVNKTSNRIFSLLTTLKGATREGNEIPSLSQVKIKKKDKISDSFDLFCVSVM